MSAQTTQSDKILELVREAGVLRPRDLDPYGIPRTYLSRLCAAGKLQRIGRGLYVLPQSSTTEHHSLVEVCKRVPNGVVYLLSALRFHEITTQAPFEVWLTIGEKAWRPRLEYPPIRIARFSKASLNTGIEEHQIEGVTVRVYTPPPRPSPTASNTATKLAWTLLLRHSGNAGDHDAAPWTNSGTMPISAGYEMSRNLTWKPLLHER